MTHPDAIGVLGIVGSPRRGGNTDTLVGEFLRGAEAGGARVERVFLSDLNVNPCLGCWACTRGGKCPQRDDMELLIDKMTRMSTWVLGTPVYFYAATAQLKTFLDRGLCVPKDTYAKAKVFSVVTLGDTTPEGASVAVQLIERTMKYHGARTIGNLIAHNVLDTGDAREKPALLRAAFEQGNALVLNESTAETLDRRASI